MLLNQQKKYSRLVNEWFSQPLGQAVARQFTAQLAQVSSHLRGENFLQLGSCGDNPWLNTLNFTYQWIASPQGLQKNNHLECTYNQLPIHRSTLDCILLPLLLEPFNNNLALLDEVDRVLKPEGFLIILSFNPFSLWGGAIKSGLLKPYFEPTIKVRTALYLSRILLQRGYEQYALLNFCYIPPINNANIIKRLAFFDEIGKMIWPFPAGFYCYIAQKHQYITPSLMPAPSASLFKKSFNGLQPVTRC